MKKYAIHCPKCKTTFDVSEQLNQWKNELFKKIEDLVNNEKEKNNR